MAEERLAAFVARKVRPAPDLTAFDAADLEEPARIAARVVWTRRVVNERLSVELALRLIELARAARIEDRGVLPALERLRDDEVSHVRLAEAMLARLGGTAPATAPRLRVVVSDEPPAVAWLREVLTGLVVCETISAARFASVLRATDLDAPRACIDRMLRDELAHAGLGFSLVAGALAAATAAIGESRARALACEELVSTFRELDRTVGLDASRRQAWPMLRPQPPCNPGIVEPALDALAFYGAVERRIVPRLESHGIGARHAWVTRWRE